MVDDFGCSLPPGRTLQGACLLEALRQGGEDHGSGYGTPGWVEDEGPTHFRYVDTGRFFCLLSRVWEDWVDLAVEVRWRQLVGGWPCGSLGLSEACQRPGLHPLSKLNPYLYCSPLAAEKHEPELSIKAVCLSAHQQTADVRGSIQDQPRQPDEIDAKDIMPSTTVGKAQPWSSRAGPPTAHEIRL